MINWNQLQISIDNQAKNQLDHYFEDLGKILDSQNLSDKKNEVFHDLENYVIDYVTNKNLKTITFSDSLQIISELGPPEEYMDFSTLPNLSEEINKRKQLDTNGKLSGIKSSTNYILCQNCNHKNEEKFLFCINCGIKLSKHSINGNQPKRSIKFVFNRNPEFSFSKIAFVFLFLFLFFLFLLVALFRITSLPIDPMEIIYGFFLIAWLIFVIGAIVARKDRNSRRKKNST